MLPKFLFADNSQENPDTIYIVHTQSPRFIIECDIEDFNTDQELHWIDERPSSDEEVEKFLDSAEQFLNDELENQEHLFDDED